MKAIRRNPDDAIYGGLMLFFFLVGAGLMIATLVTKNLLLSGPASLAFFLLCATSIFSRRKKFLQEQERTRTRT
jgi:hypothetical protein